MRSQRLFGNLFFVLGFSSRPGTGGLEGESAGRSGGLGSQREKGPVPPLGEPGCPAILDGSPGAGVAIEFGNRSVRWTGAGGFVGRSGGGISRDTQPRARG